MFIPFLSTSNRKMCATCIPMNDTQTQCLNECFTVLQLIIIYFQNLPFDINNKYKLTLLFSIFFSSGFSAPFVLVRHQILKK